MIGMVMCGVVLGIAIHEISPGSEIEIDLGLVAAGVSIVVEVPIRSEHADTWYLPESDVSCPACVEVVEWPHILNAGDEQMIRLLVTPGSEPGRHSWGAVFHGAAAPLRVRCRGVVQGLSVKPRQVRLGVCANGAVCEEPIRIEWFGPGELESVSWESDDSDVIVVPRDDCGQAWVVRVTGAREEVRNIAARMTLNARINTAGDKPKNVSCLVTATGRMISSNLRVVPASLFLGTVSHLKECEGEVRIEGVGGSLEASVEGIAGMRVRCIDTSGGSRIAVSYAPTTGTAGCVRGTIVVRSPDTEVVVARIPLIAFVRTGA